MTGLTHRGLDTEQSGWQSKDMTTNGSTDKPAGIYEIFDQPQYPADQYTVVLNPSSNGRGQYLVFISLDTNGRYYHDEFNSMATYSEWRDANLSDITDWDRLPEAIQKAVRQSLA